MKILRMSNARLYLDRGRWSFPGRDRRARVDARQLVWLRHPVPAVLGPIEREDRRAAPDLRALIEALRVAALERRDLRTVVMALGYRDGAMEVVCGGAAASDARLRALMVQELAQLVGDLLWRPERYEEGVDPPDSD
jgi:hypothetical protein